MTEATNIAAVPDDDDEYVPPSLSSKPLAAAEREVLFTLDGKEYTVPKAVQFEVSLNALRVMRREGKEAADEYVMNAILGDEGFEALLSAKGLQEEVFASILGQAYRIALGPLGASKKSGSPTTRKSGSSKRTKKT